MIEWMKGRLSLLRKPQPSRPAAEVEADLQTARKMHAEGLAAVTEAEQNLKRGRDNLQRAQSYYELRVRERHDASS